MLTPLFLVLIAIFSDAIALYSYFCFSFLNVQMQWSVALEGGPRRVNHAAVRATFITFAKKSVDFPLGDISL